MGGKHREVYTLEEGREIYPTRILKMLKIFLWNGTNLRKTEILMQQTIFVLNWTRCTVLRLMTDHQNGELKLTIMPPGPNNLSEEDTKFVEGRIVERFECKRNREYESADDIRDDLRAKFGVIIDDRTKEWKLDPNEQDYAAE